MKKIVLLYFLIAGGLFSIISSIKGQELTYTLEETIILASDSSLQAFRAKNLYLASYWEYRSYKAARLPSLTLDMTPLQYNRDFTSRYDSESNIDVYRQQQSLHSYGTLSIQQNLDLTGGTFFIDSELGYMRNFGDQVFNQFSTVPVRIGYRQDLFGFNSFKWQRKIEPLKYEKAKQQLLYNLEEIAEYSTQYFFNLAMAQTEYDMAKENVESSDTLYRIGQERQKIMSISRSDLLTLKLDAVNAKNTLKNAEIGLKRAMSDYAVFLHKDQSSVVRLILPQRPKNVYVSLDMALEYARKNHPELMAYRQEVMEAERNVEQTKKTSNFEASFYASIGFNQVAEDFSKAYKDPLQQDVVRIGMKIPLIDWGVRKGKANMARNNLNVTRISVQQKEITLEQDVIMTVNDFNVQQDMIESAEEALALANEAYEMTRERFVIGKADINSLTLSLNRQKEAQKNYINALKNYWLSYYKIRKMTLYDFEKGKPLSFDPDGAFNY